MGTVQEVHGCSDNNNSDRVVVVHGEFKTTVSRASVFTPITGRSAEWLTSANERRRWPGRQGSTWPCCVRQEPESQRGLEGGSDTPDTPDKRQSRH